MNNKSTPILVYGIIEKKQPISVSGIMQRLNLSDKTVTNAVRYLRFLHRNNGDYSYIYTSPSGYTLQKTKSAVVYESRMRVSQMIGMGINSTFVLNQCKKMAILEFKRISMEYKPKLLKMSRFLP